jgi:hypothetical protein
MPGQARQDVGQPGPGIDAVELGGLDQGVQRGGAPSTGIGAGGGGSLLHRPYLDIILGSDGGNEGATPLGGYPVMTDTDRDRAMEIFSACHRWQVDNRDWLPHHSAGHDLPNGDLSLTSEALPNPHRYQPAAITFPGPSPGIQAL